MASSGPLVSLDIDARQVRELERVFRNAPKLIPIVIAAGINDTLKQGRTLVKNEVASVVNLKKGFIAKHMRIRKARRNALSGAIHVGHRPVPLVEYASRATVSRRASRIGNQGPRLRVRVRKRSAVERKRNRFVTVVGGGHVGVFRRKSGDGLPIVEVFGPSVTGALTGAPGVERKVLRDVSNILERRIAAQMRLVLDGKRFKGVG